MGIGIAYFVIAALLWMGSGVVFQRGEVGGGILLMAIAFFVSWMTVYCLTSKDEPKTTSQFDEEAQQ